MISRDLVGGLASMVVGAVYLYFAYQLRVSALDDSLGPAGMPRIYGWLLVTLGLVLTAQAVLARLTRVLAARDGNEARAWEGEGRALAWAAGLFAIGAVYLFFVEKLGYLVAIALLILATASYLGASFGVRLLAIAVFGALVLWTVFSFVLGVAMPAGLTAAIGL